MASAGNITNIYLAGNFIQVGSILRVKIVFVTNHNDIIPFVSIFNVDFVLGINGLIPKYNITFRLHFQTLVLELISLEIDLKTVNIESIESSSGCISSHFLAYSSQTQEFTLTAKH